MFARLIPGWILEWFQTEVYIERKRSLVHCNTRTQICLIRVKNPGDNLNGYEENIKVLEPQDGSTTCEIERVDERSLRVYCVASKIGISKIALDIGSYFRFAGGNELSVSVRPSCPVKLDLVKPIQDKQFVDQATDVELLSFDCYNNVASSCEHEIIVESDPGNAVSLTDSEMRYGKYFITLKYNIKCQAKVQISVDTDGYQIDPVCPESDHACRSQRRGAVCTPISFPLDISYLPISVEESTVKIISPPVDRIKAGDSILMEIEVKDEFGEPIHTELPFEVSATIGPTRPLSIPRKFQNKRLLEIKQTNAGLHPVNVSLNGDSLPIPQSLREIRVMPSLPSCLNNINISCSSSEDPTFVPDSNVLYRNNWCSLDVDIMDEYDNIATQINIDNCEFKLETINSERPATNLQTKDLVIDKGKINVQFRPQQLGKQKLLVHLSNKTDRLQSVFQTTEIDVIESQCSLFISQQKFNQEYSKPTGITAGNEHKFKFKIYDVFGNAFRKESTTRCQVCPELVPTMVEKRTRMEESVEVDEDSQSPFLAFNITVVMNTASERQVKLIVNLDGTNSSFTRPFQVTASAPHHLNNLQFKTSDNLLTMEADVEDEHENTVTSLEEKHEIRLKSLDDQGNETRVPCSALFTGDGRIRIDLNITRVKKEHFSIIMASKNDPDDGYELQNLKLQATEGSSEAFAKDDCTSLIAGSEFKFRISENPREVAGPETNKPAAKRSEVFHNNIEVSVAFMKAGERILEVFVDGQRSVEAKIQVKPDLDQVQCEYFTEKPVSVFTKQSCKLVTKFKDCFGNQVSLDGSRLSYLVQKSGPKSGLQVVKSVPIKVKGNPSSQIIGIDYQFVQEGAYVVSLQYPGRNGDYMDVDEFTINVQNAPLNLQLSYVVWLPEFPDMIDQPLFDDDDHFKCGIHLKGDLEQEYMGEVMPAELSIVHNGKQAAILDKTVLCPTVLQAVVPLDDFQICLTEKSEFSFIYDGQKITRPLQLPFKGYSKYDKKQCERKQVSRGQNHRSTTREAFECKAVTVDEVKGEDDSHLENIQRVCCVEKAGRIEVVDSTSSTLLILPQTFPSHQLETCHKALLHLLSAIFYRKQAAEADKEREKWKEHADEKYRELKTTTKRRRNDLHLRPTFCKKIKEKYASLMSKYNREACEEIFAFFNLKRDQYHVDLHGLLVCDEDKLAAYKKQLLEEKPSSEDEVKEIIDEKRREGDEAIRKVEEKIRNFDMRIARREGVKWLEVIVGSGHHSKVKGRQKIRPKVEDYLNANTREVSVVNEGALVVTFEKYASSARCFGEYYCQDCKKVWKSGKSFRGMWQGCPRCFARDKPIQKCYPLKQRPLENGSRRHADNQQTESDGVPQHDERLCQKCIHHGSSCWLFD